MKFRSARIHTPVSDKSSQSIKKLQKRMPTFCGFYLFLIYFKIQKLYNIQFTCTSIVLFFRISMMSLSFTLIKPMNSSRTLPKSPDKTTPNVRSTFKSLATRMSGWSNTCWFAPALYASKMT